MPPFFSDAFTEDVTTELHLHPPDVGTSWSILWRTSATEFLQARAAGDAQQGGNANSGAVYTADATYPSADYEVQATVVAQAASGERSWWLLLRVTDIDNYYMLHLRGGTTQAAQIYKKAAGTYTALGTSFALNALNAVVRFQVIGDTLKVFYDGVEQKSVTDSDITATGKAGLGIGGGAESVITDADPSTSMRLDNFSVTEVGGGAQNVSIVSATETDTAQALSFTKPIFKTLVSATESDAAQLLSFTKTIFKTLGPATEADVAQGLSFTQPGGPQFVSLTAVTETDSAQALDFTKPIFKTLGPVSESDAAVVLSAIKRAALIAAIETDAAQLLSITKPIHKTITAATETDTAVALSLPEVWLPVSRRSTTAVPRRSTTAVPRRGG